MSSVAMGESCLADVALLQTKTYERIMRHFLRWFLAGAAVFVATVLAVAAETACAWQDEDAVTSVRATSSIIRRYEPGTWSAMDVFGVNTGTEDAEELVAVYFEQQPHLQFARRFWLPAGGQRRTWLPVRTPTDVTSEQTQMSASVLRLSADGDDEVFRRSEGGQLQVKQQPMVVDHDQVKTGIIFRRGELDEFGSRGDVDWDAYETAYKARQAILQSRIMLDLDTDFLPPWPQSLDSLDQIVICGDRLPWDSAGLANVQQWLQSGGRLWILLDRTDIATVRAVLGNAAACDVVDRVELSAFDVVDTSRPEGPFVAAQWESDQPVEMVRVVHNGLEDVCRVDGWPAAFWQQIGEGEVLFTTLGPRGWLTSGNDPSEPLKMIASRFYAPRVERPLPVEALQPLLNEQIGYRVPDRRWAGAILGLNTVGMLVIGGWLARRQHMDWLAIVVPALALTATLIFVAIGARNTNSVPPTVTWRQIARVEPSTNVLHVAGLAAVYDQQPAEFDFQMSGGTAALPDDLGGGGVTKRGVWDDNGACHWENVKLAPGGVHYIQFRRVVTLDQPLRASGVFGPDGFSGRLQGALFDDVSDVTVAARAAPLAAAEWNDDGTFVAGVDDVLAAGQYIAGALMSDEQRRREVVLRKVLEGNIEQKPFVDQPSLLFWSQPRDNDIQWPYRYERSGGALTAVPLEIERTPPGTEFAIPATFIRIENYSGRHGASSVFNPRTGQWLTGLNKPTNSELRFLLPPQVTPCEVVKAELAIRIHAPSRTLNVAGRANGQVTSLFEKTNPSGVLRFTIDQPELLQLDERGGLYFSIAVSETQQQREERERRNNAIAADGTPRRVQRPGSRDSTDSLDSFESSTWEIDYVRLNVWGKT